MILQFYHWLPGLRNAHLQYEVLRDPFKNILQTNLKLTISGVLYVVAEHFGDARILKEGLLRMELQFFVTQRNFKCDILRDNRDQPSEGIDKVFVQHVQLVNEIEVAVSQLGDLSHHLGVVVRAEPETVDRHRLIKLTA